MIIYQVYKRVVHKETRDYKSKWATEDRLKQEGFKYLPDSKVMEKVVYREDGYEEREVAFPRMALQGTKQRS